MTNEYAFLLQEQIDKFEEAADGINADMALAEKALKVGGDTTDESHPFSRRLA